MSLRLTCPSCQAPYEVPDEYRGRKLRCQRCQHMFVAGAPPAVAPPPVPSAPRLPQSPLSPPYQGRAGGGGPPPLPPNRQSDFAAMGGRITPAMRQVSHAGAGPIGQWGLPPWLLGLMVGGGLVLLLGVGAVAAYLLWPKSTPQIASNQPGPASAQKKGSAERPATTTTNPPKTETPPAPSNPTPPVESKQESKPALPAPPPPAPPAKVGTKPSAPAETRPMPIPPAPMPPAPTPPTKPAAPAVAKDDPPVQDGAELPRKAKAGELFVFQLKDTKGTKKWQRLGGPQGLELSEEGLIKWTPGENQVGTHDLVTLQGRFKVTVTEAGEYELFPWTVEVHSKFQYNLADLTGPGMYKHLAGVGDITPEGQLAFGAVQGLSGQQKLVYTVTNGADVKTYRFTMEIKGGPPAPVPGTRKSKHLEAKGRYVKRDNDTVLFHMTAPSGAVMAPDNVTLIVSQAAEGQLVYFDTVKNQELKRVEVDFQPAALAAQGKTLFACAKGASLVYALELETGKLIKEFNLGGDAVARVACHPTEGIVYATTTKFHVYSLDPETGKVTKTKAKGFFVAVDPVKAEFVYTGVQPPDRDEIVIKEVGDGTFRILYDRWGTRAVIMKYKVDGRELSFVGGQNNATTNGWDFHLAADGKRVMLMGGGGWRPKDEGTGGGYVTAVFSTDNLQTMVGQAPHGRSIRLHPVLKFGLVYHGGGDFTLFNSRTLAAVKKIQTPNKGGGGHAEVFLFGAKGTKLIFWNDDNFNSGNGLWFMPLELTAEDRMTLEKVHGKL